MQPCVEKLLPQQFVCHVFGQFFLNIRFSMLNHSLVPVARFKFKPSSSGASEDLISAFLTTTQKLLMEEE